MKALITDEYNQGAPIIDGPEEIIKRLKEYLLEFDKYKNTKCWGTEEFVNYLNEVVLINNDEKIKIIEIWTYKYDENLPALEI
ncbi:MAG: hypothetical protein ACTHVE_08920 [Senegalia sp. (in: firmicutes)]|uniref:hypothetical protein n=1 Tax=Senegalia sp. (in: firmicutes) TaxID=1924098 RepID=UPI003F9E2BAC